MKKKVLGYVLVEIDSDDGSINDASDVKSLKETEKEMMAFGSYAPNFYLCEVTAIESVNTIQKLNRVRLD